MAVILDSKAPSRLVRVFFFLCALPFFAVFPYLLKANNPNENVRAFMTMAIVEERSFRIDHMVERFGWTNDMAAVPSADGSRHYYSVKAPAVSYAGVPVYWAFRKAAPALGLKPATATSSREEANSWLRASLWALRLVTVQLPCFLFLLWFERYLRAFSSDVVLRLAAVAAAGLGTNYLAYANMFASHALFAVASFIAFSVTEREGRNHRDVSERRWPMGFIAGLAAGSSTLLEYHAFPVSVILAIYALAIFRHPKALAGVVAGGTVPLVAMMFFQWAAYGNPLTPGHKMVENQAFAAEHHQGIFGLLLPKWSAFANLSVDPGYGFFGMSPFMALGLLALPLVIVRQRRPTSSLRSVRHAQIATCVWLVTMASLWTAISGTLQWRGGWTIGPRYLGAAPPFFALGAVVALEFLARSVPQLRTAARGVATGTALSSVLGAGLVALVYNSLPPEGIPRPLVQFAWPMMRSGFVAHHVGEWFGISSIGPWYIVAAALIAVPFLVALARPERERLIAYGGRLVWFVAAASLSLIPIVRQPKGAPRPNLGWFTRVWEPAGRDCISLSKHRAEERADDEPCSWRDLASPERASRVPAAVRDDEHDASVPKESATQKQYFP